ncbi:hypothetical protein ZWY2020_055364 [Hordeum vulgare]|nr:hypothetical protein ZWY2020_055364 [Hordeum vulgare]
MATSASGASRGPDPASPRTARALLEEHLGKLGITDEEATPLVIDDTDEGNPEKWLLAGRVLHRHLLHIQTITNALRPAWGNPRGLQFRSMGENTFVAEFESHQDRDRVWDGSSWHISKNAVILAEFRDCMRPDEVQFDRLSLWARVPNLPYNLRNATWGKLIAQQIDKDATSVQFDHLSGYLRARVSIEVKKPLRRWILITSAKRKKTDLYDIQYEQVPHFCFSCGRLGHSELFCPNPGPRDENGELQLGPKLRAPEEKKKPVSGESSSKEQTTRTSSQRESRNSSNAGKEHVEVTSPLKDKYHTNKRKEVPRQVYRPVVNRQLLLIDGNNPSSSALHDGTSMGRGSQEESDDDSERDAKKKRPTPENSAEAAVQPCRSQ